MPGMPGRLGQQPLAGTDVTPALTSSCVQAVLDLWELSDASFGIWILTPGVQVM